MYKVEGFITEHELNLVTAYQYIRQCLEVINADNNVPATVNDIKVVRSLLARAEKLTGEDEPILQLHVARIQPAIETLISNESSSLPNASKQVIVKSLRSVQASYALDLFERLENTEFEVTEENKDTYRSIVSVSLLGEDI